VPPGSHARESYTTVKTAHTAPGLTCGPRPAPKRTAVYRGCHWFPGCEVVIMMLLIAFPQILYSCRP
jgi:hypothetical protein